MNEERYFYDSYALIEIIYGNANYYPYSKKQVILTKLNLFEIYYHTLREYGEKLAEKVIQKYLPFVFEYNHSVIREAAKFHLKYKKRNLSMTDCIGYIIAKKLEIKFLTGDEQFENLPNVEFVK